MSKYYLTTAIPYASAVPHIGNTYEAILADAVARYRRMRGDDVYFLTGTDEHGLKIETKAREQGMTPQQFADYNTGELRKIWDMCLVESDDFIRTTEKRHMDIVQSMFRRLYEKGDIYKSTYEGWYCVPDEAFYTETQVGKERVCPDCGRPVQKASEEAYFFRLSAYQERLARHYEEHPEFVQPDSRRTEMINNFIKPGLQDFCVSRTSFTWGIPVDFDEGHVVYVWVDALSNYITAMGYNVDGAHGELFKKYWPCDVHVIGKDILRFHALFWPAILMALDVPLPGQIYAHPWFLMGSDKMSKSLGNVIYAPELCAEYGADAVRYYLLREMPLVQDGNITRELFHARYNTDLANDLGNLASRSVAMVEKYFGGTLPPVPAAKQAANEVLLLAEEARQAYATAFDKLSVQAAMTEAMRIITRANPYIDQTMPWILAKDESRRDELALCLHTLCEALRRASVLLYPVMPEKVKALRAQLGLDPVPAWDEPYRESYTVTRGEILFPRKETPAEPQPQEGTTPPVKAPAPAVPEPDAHISIDDFLKVKLCVAGVLGCEPMPKSDKLLRFTLDVGEAEPRTVLSGIAAWYKPEDFAGKSVILVKNLAPRKMRGVESQGMILSVEDGDRAIVLFAPEGAKPGAILS